LGFVIRCDLTWHIGLFRFRAPNSHTHTLDSLLQSLRIFLNFRQIFHGQLAGFLRGNSGSTKQPGAWAGADRVASCGPVATDLNCIDGQPDPDKVVTFRQFVSNIL